MPMDPLLNPSGIFYMIQGEKEKRERKKKREEKKKKRKDEVDKST